MHYGSCRKNRRRAASLSPSHRPPALSFPSLQPSLRYTEASPKGSLLSTASRRFVNKYHISRSRKMLEKLEKTSIWHNVYLAQFFKTNPQKFGAI